jgi:hypothetical protein
MFWKKKEIEKPVEAPVKETVIQIDPLRLSVQGDDAKRVQDAAMYPNTNAKIADAIRQTIARAEKRGHGDHEFVKNLRAELVWRDKLIKAGNS